RDAAHHVVGEEDSQRLFRFVLWRDPRHGRHYSRAVGDRKTTSAYSGQFLNGFLMSLTQRVFASISQTYWRCPPSKLSETSPGSQPSLPGKRHRTSMRVPRGRRKVVPSLPTVRPCM